MKQKFEAIIKYITDSPFAKFDLSEQFDLHEEDNISISKKLNAAFLISLSGGPHPLYNKAVDYLDGLGSHPSWKKAVRFYRDGLQMVHSEISGKCFDDGNFEKDLNELYSWTVKPENSEKHKDTVEKIRRVFFPEGTDLYEDRDKKIDLLREKRKVNISRLNPSPVSDPAKEVLFTSNILITIPHASKGIDNIPVSSHLKQILNKVVREEQLYWYDHPIPVGTPPEQNEVLYGLEGLDRAVEFEKQRGTIGRDAKVTCVLSVSVTHEGLQGIVKQYLEDELRKEKNIRHLNVYVFTEADTLKLVEDILVPAADKFQVSKVHSLIYEVFGVDGEYGRHYSFLKAIAALWQVFIAPEIKGTFKIDLDQVFPQEELVGQSGLSALEHLKTPLWGAEGVDSEGNDVRLGMIAGALVNQKDIGKSLFTPDVTFPSDEINADELIFFSKFPQAVSTEAEMMTRYTDNEIDGKKHCIQRIHVTGGTNGILIDLLRKFRPFTPTFIGRAEDQAYILSVLSDGNNENLRYVHKDGLIMRHDKEAFAGEAIKMAATGKLIGDYIRILMFSYYARALPRPFKDIKKTIDPFTGCFVSRIPLTVVYLRFALKLASFFGENSEEKDQQGFEFSQFGIKRLHETIKKLSAEPNPLIKQFDKEKQGWDIFYDVLDKAEENIGQNDSFALEMKEKVEVLVESCRINF
jgi:hypothetical protein